MNLNPILRFVTGTVLVIFMMQPESGLSQDGQHSGNIFPLYDNLGDFSRPGNGRMSGCGAHGFIADIQTDSNRMMSPSSSIAGSSRDRMSETTNPFFSSIADHSSAE